MILIYELALNFGLIFVFIIIYILIPKLTMPTIQFGVRIPPTRTNDPRLQEILKTYRLRLLSYSVPVVVLAAVFYSDYLLDTLIVMFEIIASLVAYLQAHYRLLKIEDEEDWYSDATQVSFAALSTEGTPIDMLFLFVPMILVAILTTVIGIEIYPTLPKVLAVHFSSNGTPNGYALKSYASVLELPITQFVLAIIFIVTAYFTIKSKINVEAYAPKNSYKAQTLFRNRTIVLLAFIGIIIEIVLLISSLAEWGLIKKTLIMPSALLFVAMILAITVVFSIHYGQMGSRILIKMHEDTIAPDTKEANIDDNKEWKAGIIYANKEDRSIFVPKRFGVGYTINWANPKAVILIVLIILLASIVPLLIAFLLK